MRLLLLIVFIMGFVVFAEPTQHVGGLMHGDGSYIPGILTNNNMSTLLNGVKDTNQLSFMNKIQRTVAHSGLGHFISMYFEISINVRFGDSSIDTIGLEKKSKII